MVDNLYICGADGSGKTTYIESIEKYLSERDVQTHHIWLRSPKILSKPLMLFCRLIGLTKYEKINGIKYGKHEFYKSKIISWLFPVLQLIDFRIKWFFVKSKLDTNSIILIDRFSLDTLADLMVDIHRFDLHKTWIGRKFINYIPQGTKTLLLTAKEDLIRNRKLDTLHDPNLEIKLKVYNILAKDLDLVVIDNNGTQEETFQKILNELELDGRN